MILTISLIIMVYSMHKIIRTLIAERIDRDANERIFDAKKRVFQGKMYLINRRQNAGNKKQTNQRYDTAFII